MNYTHDKVTAIEIRSANQMLSGCRWLTKHAGAGRVWKLPPANPKQSRYKWWTMLYPTGYVIWIKNPKTATLFLLSLANE